MRLFYILLFVFFIFIISGFKEYIYSQEFPIAVGTDTTFSAGAIYSGGNGLVAIYGNNSSQFSINAQLIDGGGTLIGSRIFLNSFGVFPGPITSFDGSNYFLVWCDLAGSLKGRFISTSGSIVGNELTIATNINTNRPAISLCLGDTSYLITYVKSDNYIYGRLVGKSGAIIGNQILISNIKARENSIAFDGSNFLVAWVEDINDKDIYGQFISKSSSLVGTNFLINSGPYFSDNPISMSFDGSRYFLVFHEQTLGQNWFISGVFITPAGAVQENIIIVPLELAPSFPSISFDGQNYLITWTQFSDGTFRGRFFNKSGIPINESFTIMFPSETKIPVGGIGFGGGRYLAVATRLNQNFSDGDVYGRFISPLTSIKNNFELANDINLYQNYPNPFNSTTNIKYSVNSNQFVSLKVYGVLGNEMTSLVNEEKDKGIYEVQINLENLSSGIYFYQLKAGDFIQTKKMIYLK